MRARDRRMARPPSIADSFFYQAEKVFKKARGEWLDRAPRFAHAGADRVVTVEARSQSHGATKRALRLLDSERRITWPGGRQAESLTTLGSDVFPDGAGRPHGGSTHCCSRGARERGRTRPAGTSAAAPMHTTAHRDLLRRAGACSLPTYRGLAAISAHVGAAEMADIRRAGASSRPIQSRPGQPRWPGCERDARCHCGGL